MSSTLYWILAGSVGVALIVMVVAFVITRVKINNIKNQYAIKPEDTENVAIKRENHGILLWEDKKKAKNPMNDLALEFAINTSIRNRYKTFEVKGYSNYENKTLTQIAKMKSSKAKKDILILDFDKEYIDKIDKDLKQINKGGMILIINSSKNKELKRLMNYLKLTGIRHEWTKDAGGIVLVAK